MPALLKACPLSPSPNPTAPWGALTPRTSAEETGPSHPQIGIQNYSTTSSCQARASQVRSDYGTLFVVLVVIGAICVIIIVLGLLYNCWQRRLPKLKHVVSMGHVPRRAWAGGGACGGESTQQVQLSETQLSSLQVGWQSLPWDGGVRLKLPVQSLAPSLSLRSAGCQPRHGCWRCSGVLRGEIRCQGGHRLFSAEDHQEFSCGNRTEGNGQLSRVRWGFSV